MPYYQFKEAVILRVTGDDSTRYLQARLTNAVDETPPGCAGLAAVLTPQGKTSGLYLMLCLEQNSFLLIGDGGNSEQLMQAVQQFRVTERVVFEDLSAELSLLHIFGATTSHPALKTLTNDDISDTYGTFTIASDFYIAPNNRGPEIGFDLVGPRAKITELHNQLAASGQSPLSDGAQILRRILGRKLSFPFDMSTRHIFADFGVTDAISRNKGCYVGQEVVEKAIARGQSARKLVRLVSESDQISPGQDVNTQHGKRIGEVLSAARNPEDGNMYCFALVRNDPQLLSESLQILSSPARLLEDE